MEKIKKHKDAKSKYNGVSFNARKHEGGKKKWFVNIRINGILLPQLYYNTEREAAIGADLVYIQYGDTSKLNILKPKKHGVEKELSS